MDLVQKAAIRLKNRNPHDWRKRLNQHSEEYGGHTTLSLAILEERIDMVNWLIGFGADFDARDRGTGMGPIHHAVRKVGPRRVHSLSE